MRKSTGEEFNINLKEYVIPDGLFELRKEVKITKTATPDENLEFKTK